MKHVLIYKSNYSASTVKDITHAFKQEKKRKLGIYCLSKHITLGAVHSNLLLGKNLLFQNALSPHYNSSILFVLN